LKVRSVKEERLFLYNTPMKSELYQRLHNTLRIDRLEATRAYADNQRSYCFFASMYEAASHLYGEQLPLRFAQVEEEWLSFGSVGETKGGVSPENLFPQLLKIADHLHLKIEKIYANPSAYELFMQTKDGYDDEDTSDTDSEEDDCPEEVTVYNAHAESETFLNRSTIRIQQANENEWKTVLIATFSKSPEEGYLNSIETIVIEKVQGKQTVYPSIPYVSILLKEMEK
jgi:hypothetical protein